MKIWLLKSVDWRPRAYLYVDLYIFQPKGVDCKIIVDIPFYYYMRQNLKVFQIRHC